MKIMYGPTKPIKQPTNRMAAISAIECLFCVSIEIKGGNTVNLSDDDVFRAQFSLAEKRRRLLVFSGLSFAIKSFSVMVVKPVHARF